MKMTKAELLEELKKLEAIASPDAGEVERMAALRTTLKKMSGNGNNRSRSRGNRRDKRDSRNSSKDKDNPSDTKFALTVTKQETTGPKTMVTKIDDETTQVLAVTKAYVNFGQTGVFDIPDLVDGLLDNLIKTFSQNLGFAVTLTADELKLYLEESMHLQALVSTFRKKQDCRQFQGHTGDVELGLAFSNDANWSGRGAQNVLADDPAPDVFEQTAGNLSNARYRRNFIEPLSLARLPERVMRFVDLMFGTFHRHTDEQGITKYLDLAPDEYITTQGSSGTEFTTIETAIADSRSALQVLLQAHPALSGVLDIMECDYIMPHVDYTRDLAQTTLRAVDANDGLMAAINNWAGTASAFAPVSSPFVYSTCYVKPAPGNLESAYAREYSIQVSLEEFAWMDLLRGNDVTGLSIAEYFRGSDGVGANDYEQYSIAGSISVVDDSTTTQMQNFTAVMDSSRNHGLPNMYAGPYTKLGGEEVYSILSGEIQTQEDDQSVQLPQYEHLRDLSHIELYFPNYQELFGSYMTRVRSVANLLG